MIIDLMKNLAHKCAYAVQDAVTGEDIERTTCNEKTGTYRHEQVLYADDSIGYYRASVSEGYIEETETKKSTDQEFHRPIRIVLRPQWESEEHALVVDQEDRIACGANPSTRAIREELDIWNQWKGDGHGIPKLPPGFVDPKSLRELFDDRERLMRNRRAYYQEHPEALKGGSHPFDRENGVRDVLEHLNILERIEAQVAAYRKEHPKVTQRS